jgi:hypothetical protein
VPNIKMANQLKDILLKHDIPGYLSQYEKRIKESLDMSPLNPDHRFTEEEVKSLEKFLSSTSIINKEEDHS